MTRYPFNDWTFQETVPRAQGFHETFLRRCDFSNILKEFHETLALMLNWFLTRLDRCAVFLVPHGASGLRTSAQQCEPAITKLYVLRLNWNLITFNCVISTYSQ